MADLGQILEILQIVEKIITALAGMGLKMEGTVNIATILGLFGKSNG